MEYIRKAEVYSNLIKLKIFFLEQRIIPGSLVFESRDPLSGYYSQTPDSSPPVYLYLVLDKAYWFEEIMKATQKVRLSVPEVFDAAMGIVNVGNEEPQFVIRWRNFRDIHVIVPLQEVYQEQGIAFLKLSWFTLLIAHFSGISHIGQNSDFVILPPGMNSRKSQCSSPRL